MLVALLEPQELVLAATVERLFLVQLHLLVVEGVETFLLHQVLAAPAVLVVGEVLEQLIHREARHLPQGKETLAV
jgi:hypothetical protein